MDKKGNTIELKRINRSKIYQYIYKKEPQSKQDIAYALKLSIPTVAQNISSLEQQGLIINVGMLESTGGRKAQAVVFNPKAHFAIGLDVTRNHLGCVIIDLGGNIHKGIKVRCPFEDSFAYFQKVADVVENSIDEIKIDRNRILGVGISVPAIVSQAGQEMTYSQVLGINQGNLKGFSDHLKYQCIFRNDANAAGFAETWNRGAVDNMIYLSLNNSVGGCIVLNGLVSTGCNQRSGEFGHMTIVPNGERCYCGQLGCLDAYCNAKVLSDNTEGNLELFFENVKNKDPKYVGIWNSYLENLAIGVNNLRMAFDYDVVIGGYVGAHMDEHIECLRNLVANKNTFEKDGSYLKVCNYKSEATAVGAALYYIDNFIKSV